MRILHGLAGVAQLVRALDCGSRGQRFDPASRYHYPITRMASKEHLSEASS